jgi:hypothetical protein
VKEAGFSSAAKSRELIKHLSLSEANVLDLKRIRNVCCVSRAETAYQSPRQQMKRPDSNERRSERRGPVPPINVTAKDKDFMNDSQLTRENPQVLSR